MLASNLMTTVKENRRDGNELSWLPECRAVIEAGLDLVLSRFDPDGGYPFINTKLSAITGKDFEEVSDEASDFRGRSAVFGWIQGRGMEALARHAAYLADDAELALRCDRMLAVVASRMASFAKDNHGRFAFLFTPEGKPFRRGADGLREYFPARDMSPGYADLFVGKGLIAAGMRLRNKEITDLGISTFRAVAGAIETDRFVSDQISFDPKNPVAPCPGRFGQGPWMIALGGFALLCELFPGADEWVEGGCACLGRLLDRHVVKVGAGCLRRFDYVEWTDEKGHPWVESGRIIQDSGHALEFTGLAARFLRYAVAGKPRFAGLDEMVEKCRTVLPDVFFSAYANGFRRPAGGICKTFDLVSRMPVNDDMPWWPLPETMRAAVLLSALVPDHPRAAEFALAATECARAFLDGYRSPVPGLFLQTRDAGGNATTSIPAIPDADPGYHTGLCFIDCSKILKA